MVPAGTIIKAFTDEDVPLAMAASAPPPLVVGVPAAPMVVQPAPAQPQAAAKPQGN